MYTLVDGVEFYDKDEIDTIVESITGGTMPDEEKIRTELTAKINEEATVRTAADEALDMRIDEERKKRMDSDALFSKLIAGEVESRINVDTAFANQLAAIEQLHTTLISPNGFIDSDGDAVNVNDSGKSIRQIAHEEFYRQLITDADDVKTQLDTLKELADYLQHNPSIITDMYNKLGITWSVDNPTDFGAFDFSTVLTATNVDDAVLELYATFTDKIGDLTQLTTTFKNNIVGAVNELDADIDEEVTARTDADTALGTRIDEEISARTDADTALGTRIDEEVTARTDADTALGTRIDEEISARTDADTALGTRIDEEVTARTDADTALGTRIDEEISARTDADTALGTRIDESIAGNTALDAKIGGLNNLKTTDKSSTVAAINELYDTVQQGGGGGGGTGGDTGNTVDYYVIGIEASLNGIKPNEPLRFEGDLDPDVANGITEAVAAGKALMLKIVNSSADGISPSSTIVITNYSYTNGSYTFDMNDATITGNQIIVVDYNAVIRPDVGDYYGYATLSTVTVPEGGGTGSGSSGGGDGSSSITAIVDVIYPVGSLYWSSKPTNPSTLFGGTWEQIKDVFVLASGDTYTAGATGGNANTTLAVENLPSHSHSFTPKGAVSAHNHGLNAHTHSFSATTGGDGTHDHVVSASGWSNYASGGTLTMYVPDFDSSPAGDRATLDFTKDYGKSTNPKTGAHTHTISGTTEAASGSTANATPTFTGTTGVTGNTGSGTAFSNMPPYVVKYCWERIA